MRDPVNEFYDTRLHSLVLLVREGELVSVAVLRVADHSNLIHQLALRQILV